MGSINKHIKLLKPYARMSFKMMSEYKFAFITNTLQFILFLIIWIVFWKILVLKMGVIGEWNEAMLTMLVGFTFINEALFQITWASQIIPEDIVQGNMDLYLVKPVNPIFAIIMKRLQLFSLGPAIIGISLVLITLINNYESNIIKILISTLVIIFNVIILQLIFLTLGYLSFWFGRTSAFRAIFRSFKQVDRHPTTIFPNNIIIFFTFIIPKIFLGTFPVLILIKFSIKDSLFVLLQIILLTIVWLGINIIVWRKGLKRYESHGG